MLTDAPQSTWPALVFMDIFRIVAMFLAALPLMAADLALQPSLTWMTDKAAEREDEWGLLTLRLADELAERHSEAVAEDDLLALEVATRSGSPSPRPRRI